MSVATILAAIGALLFAILVFALIAFISGPPKPK
jgi:hypothetical protein